MTTERTLEAFVTDWQLSESEGVAGSEFVAHGTRDEFIDNRVDALGLGRDEQVRQHLAAVLQRLDRRQH